MCLLLIFSALQNVKVLFDWFALCICLIFWLLWKASKFLVSAPSGCSTAKFILVAHFYSTSSNAVRQCCPNFSPLQTEASLFYLLCVMQKWNILKNIFESHICLRGMSNYSYWLFTSCYAGVALLSKTSLQCALIMTVFFVGHYLCM